jgi:hypothetical protein
MSEPGANPRQYWLCAYPSPYPYSAIGAEEVASQPALALSPVLRNSSESSWRFRSLFRAAMLYTRPQQLGGHMNQISKFTKQQLASHLGVSVRQIDVMVQRQELPPGVRSGRQLFWIATVVEKCEERRHAEQSAWANG